MALPGINDPILERPMARLALASATGLFLELACIRWGGAHVLYLSYVSNFLLITCFLGLGVGCLIAGRLGPERVTWAVSAVPLLLIVLIFFIVFFEVEVVVNAPNVVYFLNERSSTALPAWVVLPLLALLATALFCAVGCAVGRELGRTTPLRAYSFDVAGSLAGIALFALGSLLRLPAWAWFGIAALAWLPLLPKRRLVVYACAACVPIAMALVAWADVESLWSPYYRVSVSHLGPSPGRFEGDPTTNTPFFRLRVNSVTHQFISDFRRREPFYEFPYRALGIKPPGLPAEAYFVDTRRYEGETLTDKAMQWGGRVAILGAGNGTDTAFALAYGAARVDAVEIDPLIAEIGLKLHPNRPFSDPRVEVHTEDARAFLERAAGRYDLIVFGLPDSLTLASPYVSLRLESFLLTSECFRKALSLLEPRRGLLVAYNYYREPWLIGRIASTLRDAAGTSVMTLVGPDRNLSAVFIAGPGLSFVPRDVGSEWGFKRYSDEKGVGALSPTRDDWPFPYLKRPSVPSHLATGMGLVIAFALTIVFLAIRLTRGGRSPESSQGIASPLRGVAPFFFMGVAFLLLETVGLVRMALLFGATWFVNALVFFGVLSMVMLANLAASRLRLRRSGLLVTLLLASLALAWAVPADALASLPALPRYAGATLLLFVPIFLANLVFSRAFRDTATPALAFGANLLGAVVGGALETLSMLLGFQALFVVAAALYVAAAASQRPRKGVRNLFCSRNYSIVDAENREQGKGS